MDVGKINKLKVQKAFSNGYYLTDAENEEVILPNSNITTPIKTSDEIEVFVYKNEDGQLIASMSKPYAQLDQFAFLKVTKISSGTVFMDWGMPNDLKIPYAEQNQKMLVENWYLIFILKDENSGEIIGSSKIDDFVFYDEIDLKTGDEVDILLYRMTDLGMNVIVNNLFKGLIHNSNIHKNISPGDKTKGYVKLVREDGKIDVLLEPMGYRNSIDSNSEIILKALETNDGFLELTDKSDPDQINQMLGLSKKAFKKALGKLYKLKIVEIYQNGIKKL